VNPLMPLSLWKVRNFWSGNIATALIYGSLSLNFFALGVYLQQGAGLPATLAGLATIPVTLIMILFSGRVGALAGRFGPRLFMTIGPIIAGFGAALLLAIGEPFDYWRQVLPGILVFGVGMTLTVSPLTSAILGAIEPEHAGIASAVNNAVSRVAGLIVIAMLALIIGGTLDLDGLHRAVATAAAVLILGGVVSFFGIRNPVRDTADNAPGPRRSGRRAPRCRRSGSPWSHSSPTSWTARSTLRRATRPRAHSSSGRLSTSPRTPHRSGNSSRLSCPIPRR